jgi:cytochrome c-type biogenesis protein CcmH/NrfG
MSETPPSRGRTLAEEIVRLRQLASLAPHDVDVRLDLARRLLDNRLPDEAVHEIRAVIAMSPNHLEARKLLERAVAAQFAEPT